MTLARAHLQPEPRRRAAVTRWLVPLALISALAVASVAAIHFLTAPDDAAALAADAVAAPATPLRGAPARGATGDGRREPNAVAHLTVEPLFDSAVRFKPGDSAKLRFGARDRASGGAATKAEISVSLFHGREELRLPASEVEDGVYEVDFTPDAPGQYRLLVRSGGAPIASLAPVKLGVVGAAGAWDEDVGASASLEADPRTSRSKGVGRRMR
jgi:hypothetical protein